MIGAEQVKLIAFDVDGTLTDGTLSFIWLAAKSL